MTWELSEHKSLFVEHLNSILKRQSTRKHIRNIQYLSNKEPLEKDFLELQSAIFETATEFPLKSKKNIYKNINKSLHIKILEI
jgi:hypothetical protein